MTDDQTPIDAAPAALPAAQPTAPDTPAPSETPAVPSRQRTSADLSPRMPAYRGDELDPERGPGLGCFWFQLGTLTFFLVLIPVGIALAWPYEVLAVLLFIVLGLLLFVGQTVIFLGRLVAAGRRDGGRRRPLASTTKTVGELEDEAAASAQPAPDPTTARHAAHAAAIRAAARAKAEKAARAEAPTAGSTPGNGPTDGTPEPPAPGVRE